MSPHTCLDCGVEFRTSMGLDGHLCRNRGRDWLAETEHELRRCIVSRRELYDALRVIYRRLDSASAEVDCFNVYEARDVARDAIAKFEGVLRIDAALEAGF
jgi:hypothetical protein